MANPTIAYYEPDADGVEQLVQREMTDTEHAAWQAETAEAAAAAALVEAAGANREQLLVKAAAALEANKTYLAIATPTQAQAVTQVAALTRQVNALIRIVAAALDTIDGT